MDDPWRFRPFSGGGGGGAALCPTCFTAHFPFCPPPSSFDRGGYPGGDPLRRFAAEFPHPLEPFHRPFHAPPFDRPPPPPVPFPPPLPMAGRAAEPWEASQRLIPNDFLERGGLHKRMRVEEPFSSNFPPPRMSSDDERRLSLIRDHGRQDAAPFGGDQYSNGENRVASYDYGVHGPPGIGFAGGNNGFPLPDPQFTNRSHLVQTKSYEGYRNFPEREDRGFDANKDGVPDNQMGDSLHERKDFGTRDFDLSDAGQFNPQIQDYLYGRSGHGLGDSIGNTENLAARVPEERPLYDSQSYRHGDPFRRAESYRTRAPEERSFFDSLHKNYSIESFENHMAPISEEQLPLHGSRHEVSFPMQGNGSRVSYDMYGSHDRQLHPTESSPYQLPKQSEYPITDTYRVAPNVVNHEQESSHRVRKPQYPEAMQAPSELKRPIPEDIQRPFEQQPFPVAEQACAESSKQDDYLSVCAKSSSYNAATSMPGEVGIPQMQPSLPPQSRPRLHQEPSPTLFRDIPLSSILEVPPVPIPVPAFTSDSVLPPPPAYSFSDTHPLSRPHPYNEPSMHNSTGFAAESFPFINVAPSKQYLEEGGPLFPLKNYSKDKPTIIDACHLFKPPHRASRPDHIVIILRGLPGSGKSYLAKALRDIEVENGGSAPRIHAMDDYFMIEVEKVEDNEGSKSAGSVRGKRPISKKVIEYCYEPEMEEAYRSSMLKAFKKTLDEGIFTFVIVDDRNLRVADFAQFWAIAKRSGYEVYLLEATYKDPTGCAVRNVHGFTLDDIQKMARQWEEAPSLYLKLDIQSLFHGDDLNEHSIQEVDMDTDDGAVGEDEIVQLQDRNDIKTTETKSSDDASHTGSIKVGDRWDAEEDEEDLAGIKELRSSKWSKDFDEEDIENSDGAKEKLNALSGLIQAYGKGEKSVHWGDRVDKSGFSIGAVKKQSTSSLIIGPGSGYNLKSNPLPEEENPQEVIGRGNVSDSKKRFHEQLRAERESFRAVFDRRRQRIGGLYDAEEE